MIYIFFVIWLAIGAGAFLARTRKMVHILCAIYMAVHAVFAAMLACGKYMTTSGAFFTFDEAGTLFYIL
ncbi:MAG: hydrogenase 4 subunit F, partial [Alistipes sp.]|nr:hydrogenase 4 subunit F [Alistipes sp.]